MVIPIKNTDPNNEIELIQKLNEKYRIKPQGIREFSG